MANTYSGSNHLNKSFCGLALMSFVLMMQNACGTKEFLVGGSSGWRVPADSNSESYNQWAERNRFQVGDSLVFVYPPNQDSVLCVTSDAYAHCKTDAPIEKFTDGHTSFKLKQSGPNYFVSGNKDNCLKNEKLVVIVMADRSNHSSNTEENAPVSSPPMGSVGETPAEAPAGQVAPAPAPKYTDSIPTPTPNPTPSDQSHPPSAASPLLINFIGFIGAFIHSALFLMF